MTPTRQPIFPGHRCASSVLQGDSPLQGQGEAHPQPAWGGHCPPPWEEEEQDEERKEEQKEQPSEQKKKKRSRATRDEKKKKKEKEKESCQLVGCRGGNPPPMREGMNPPLRQGPPLEGGLGTQTQPP